MFEFARRPSDIAGLVSRAARDGSGADRIGCVDRLWRGTASDPVDVYDIIIIYDDINYGGEAAVASIELLLLSVTIIYLLQHDGVYTFDGRLKRVSLGIDSGPSATVYLRL